tara:strand:- start:90 stop:545 length:456 start_codon:yes stop_codon:yes gene_type:complete
MSRGNSISQGIRDILINGINLNLESIEEEQYYITKLIEYFENKTEFTAYLKKDNVMEIETKEMQLAMEVCVINSTLFMLPMMNDIFEVFTEILKFISSEHLSVVSEFRGIEEIRIENIDDVNKYTKGINDNATEAEEAEEESSDDDDFEWI